MASKEQVESLGGKFLTVEGSENLETEGGYAKETTDDFKRKQEELLSETLKKIDIVICTALIPGKKAPIIITDEMIDGMQQGSVIFDLAAVQGGNVAFTEVDKVIERKGIKIIGINFRDDEENFKEWINEHGNPFEYILRDDGTIAYEMGLIGVPETFFIVNKMTQKKIQGPLFYEDVEKYF